MLLQEVIIYDTRANQPSATTVPVGTIYYVTDESVTERSNGTTWDDISDVTGITALTGDVTASGVGSQAATIANGAVTYAKMQDVSAASRIIGRGSAAGSGDPEELSATAGVEISSTNVQTTTAVRTRTVGIVIDGGGSAISTGVKGYIQFPVAGTIVSNTLLADQTGDIVIDVWKDTYGNYPPDDSDSITASAPPTLSSADKSTDATLTGWTTAVTAGDVFGFNVDSAATVERVTLTLVIQISGA